ncbi:Isoprenyl transferase [Psilocybe cubensis]|uniref:Isoprenyl transferase n=2 Tax=Psilocybe cubensis TaxID=181762 RepID=A0ACB8GZK2_PSICU|nr:Isoprenyl transferase [Psilocybe cubensis]KAH9481056.1 Isoprenyl transferase [Psilocybe cubensis]
MRNDIISDLRPQIGAAMSLFASGTALILEAHHPSISVAVQTHSEFYSRPLTRLLKTFLFAEMMFNGTSEEREQTASWLAWMHRNIHGRITIKAREELRLPEDFKSYGYTDDLKAWVMHSLTYATIAFQMRYGQPLSKRAKDTIVLENTCVALRLGVPDHLLARDYESFMAMFNRQLDLLDHGHSASQKLVEEIENAATTSNIKWPTAILFRLGLMIGHDLLPEKLRNQYQLKALRSPWQRCLQKIVISVLWLVYPVLMWLPLRGVITLLLVLEPSTRSIFMVRTLVLFFFLRNATEDEQSSLQAIHSMDTMNNLPIFHGTPDPASILASSSYLQWLDSGKDGRPFLQVILVRILEVQLMSAHAAQYSWWPIMGSLYPWLMLPGILAWESMASLYRTTKGFMESFRTKFKESTTFKGNQIKLPQHDGNRRFARMLGTSIDYGHYCGGQTAINLVVWWIRYLQNTTLNSHPGPRYLTFWAFSAENMRRPPGEVDGIFRLLSNEFRTFAFTSIVHLFQIRMRIIGDLTGYPRELLDSVKLLEESTSKYDRLFLQIAVGYGGRDEIVQSVNLLQAQGKAVTEAGISAGTYCAQAGIPPVDLIVRTSEKRTSGFLLWDTKAAELHFIDKLWPQLTVNDWLDVLSSYSKREIRGGK